MVIKKTKKQKFRKFSGHKEAHEIPNQIIVFHVSFQEIVFQFCLKHAQVKAAGCELGHAAIKLKCSVFLWCKL